MWTPSATQHSTHNGAERRCRCCLLRERALTARVPLARRRLKDRFPGIKALAAPKADRDYPIVSAASICAKVTRDNQLRDWAFEPALQAAAPPSRNFGCGYPGGACVLAGCTV